MTLPVGHMTRKFNGAAASVLLAAFVVGCTSTGSGPTDRSPSTPQPAPVAIDPNKTCDTGDFAKYVGGSSNALTSGPEARGLAVRIVTAGSPITMDFNPQRVNVELEDDGATVKAVFCG